MWLNPNVAVVVYSVNSDRGKMGAMLYLGHLGIIHMKWSNGRDYDYVFSSIVILRCHTQLLKFP